MVFITKESFSLTFSALIRKKLASAVTFFSSIEFWLLYHYQLQDTAVSGQLLLVRPKRSSCVSLSVVLSFAHELFLLFHKPLFMFHVISSANFRLNSSKFSQLTGKCPHIIETLSTCESCSSTAEVLVNRETCRHTTLSQTTQIQIVTVSSSHEELKTEANESTFIYLYSLFFA